MNEVIIQLLLREGPQVNLSMFSDEEQKQHLVEAGKRLFENKNQVQALPYFRKAGTVLFREMYLELADQYAKMGEKQLAIAIYDSIGESQVAHFLRSNE